MQQFDGSHYYLLISMYITVIKVENPSINHDNKKPVLSAS